MGHSEEIIVDKRVYVLNDLWMQDAAGRRWRNCRPIVQRIPIIEWCIESNIDARYCGDGMWWIEDDQQRLAFILKWAQSC